MSDTKPFYITTTLPYVNSDPHIGFAMEIIRADIIARYKKLQGFDVFFNTGTDEHGLKIYQKAFDFGQSPQAYVDEYVKKFQALKDILGLSEDIHFIRTTDAHHVTAAQEFWKVCDKNGYIYKKKYKARYCVGCEAEKTDSEIENEHCFLHPNLELLTIEEENYFFTFSKFQKLLLDFYQKNPDFVIPDFRFNEIKAFVSRGLEDFSISRLKEKMPWGVPVPGDENHVMYVWFDALVNYISTVGWPEDEKAFKKYWEQGTPVQYCGKDNLRQQSAMWQAMLMAAGLPQTRHIVIDGFITSGGQKMSKSLGNVISPLNVVKEYGTDALRYYLVREIPPFEDGDFTLEKFKLAYNANLANGLGNLVSRIMKMATTHAVVLSEEEKKTRYYNENAALENLEKYNIKAEADEVWQSIAGLDEYIQHKVPFKVVKTDPEEAKKDIHYLLFHLFGIALRLEPLLPGTALKIQELIRDNKMPEQPLFVRKD